MTEEKQVRGVYNTKTGKIEYQPIEDDIVVGSINLCIVNVDKQRKAMLGYLHEISPEHRSFFIQSNIGKR